MRSWMSGWLMMFVALCVHSCVQTGGASRSSENAINDLEKIRLADPTVFPFDGQYYLYGTESPPQSGFPVLTSTDLVSWQVPTGVEDGYVLKKGARAFGDWGFWAPQVFRHNGSFHLAYTANERIAIAHSDSPLGPFLQGEKTPLTAKWRQIDPFVFKDDDNRLYLYHVRLDEGNHIYVAELEYDLSGTKPGTLTHCISPEPSTWEDTQTYESPLVAEGATVIKHKHTYYLFYSTNHFKSVDYAVGYATADSPLGPWTRYADNPIISRKSIGVNGTGHGDFFVDKQGQPYYVFHTHGSATSVRPRATMIVKLRFKAIDGQPDTVEIDATSAFYPHKTP